MNNKELRTALHELRSLILKYPKLPFFCNKLSYMSLSGEEQKFVLGFLRPIAEELGAEPLSATSCAWIRPNEPDGYKDYFDWKVKILDTAIRRL